MAFVWWISVVGECGRAGWLMRGRENMQPDVSLPERGGGGLTSGDGVRVSGARVSVAHFFGGGFYVGGEVVGRVDEDCA